MRYGSRRCDMDFTRIGSSSKSAPPLLRTNWAEAICAVSTVLPVYCLDIQNMGYEVILVSSGAIAVGSNKLGLKTPSIRHETEAGGNRY